MFCTNCGKENPDSNKFCLQCGQPLASGAGGAAGPPPTRQAAQRQPRGASSRLPLIIGGVLLLAVLAAGAYFLLPRLTGGGGREMLLAAPNRNGEVDLSVLKLGDDLREAVIIAENVLPPSRVFLGTLNESGSDFDRFYGGIFGNFLPGAGRLLAAYDKDGKTRLVDYTAGAEAPIEILNGENAAFAAALIPGSRDLLIVDMTNSSSSRCYVAAPGEEAARVARGDECGPTANGTRFLTQNSNSRGELTLTVADLNGENETTLLDDVVAQYARVSADASHVAYLSGSSGDQSIVLLDAAGEELFTSDEISAINGFDFAGKSDTVYFVDGNDDGEWELRTSAGGGSLAAAPFLSVLAAPDGATLAVLTTDEDGTGKITMLNLSTGESVVITSGDNLQMARITDPPRLLVKDEVDGDLKLIAVEWSGANAVTLFDDSDYTLGDISNLPGDKRVLMRLTRDGLLNLYAASLDGTVGHFILEDWSAFRVLNQSDSTLLLTGHEDGGDDEALYATSLAPDAKLVELDDSADRYEYAVVAPDGRSAIYSAIIGDNPDDVVVRQAGLDGKERPADLFDEMSLVAARWSPDRPVYASFLDAGEGAPGAMERVIDGSSYLGRIDQRSTFDLGGDIGSGYGKVYYFDGLQGQTVHFDVLGKTSIDSALDPFTTLLDDKMDVLYADDDSGSGTDSRIGYTLPRDGRYFLVIRSANNSFADDFNFQVWMELQ